ncbi:hypothetical protein ABKN59_008438 [Abortiporus biennis]
MKISSRGRYKDSWLGNFKSLIIYTVSIYHKHKQCGPTTVWEVLVEHFRVNAKAYYSLITTHIQVGIPHRLLCSFRIVHSQARGVVVLFLSRYFSAEMGVCGMMQQDLVKATSITPRIHDVDPERGSKHRVNTSQLSSYLVRLRRPSFEDKYGAGNLLQILTQSTI